MFPQVRDLDLCEAAEQPAVVDNTSILFSQEEHIYLSLKLIL